MSCLLEKLAPETRTMVYEYVLSFDKPLKHATKMQPFIEKLTGVKPNSTSGSTGLETETAMEFRLVNTSLLTVNKLIYLEAVAVFYKHNSFYYDAEMCTFESLVSPCATDLSLAKQIFVKMDDAVDPEVEDKFGEAVNLSLTTIPAIFPMMRTCSVNISADTGPHATCRDNSDRYLLQPTPFGQAQQCSLRRRGLVQRFDHRSTLAQNNHAIETGYRFLGQIC
jgi:hypothetical protein